MRPSLRVAINAQFLPDGDAGGLVTVLRALAALAELDDGDEEYVFVGPYENPDWLRSILAPGQQIVRGAEFMSAWAPDRLEPLKKCLGPLRPLARGLKDLFVGESGKTTRAALSESDSQDRIAPLSSRNFFQRLGCDVVHFPFQSFELSGIPSVYNPHDLQHVHLPDFFSPTEISRREKLYPFACRESDTVVVASHFVKRDVVEYYGVDPEKVQVIPWAPPALANLSEEPDANVLQAIRSRYKLSDGPFALYPAMTWEHKNHIRLLEAVAFLRDSESLSVRLICTGFKTDFWPTIERRLNELHLNELVKFPGLIPLHDLTALYRTAQFVFVPTLFEAVSAPAFEAWQAGAPLACSAVTSLPEQVTDAALLFDPLSVKEIASALAQMTVDFSLREHLRRCGTRRLRDFSLERTAKAYRAVYRRTAGRELDEEDRVLLAHDPLPATEKEVHAA